MEQSSDHIQTYKKVRVNTAHPMKIIVMLYDEMLKQIDVAGAGLDGGVGKYGAVNAALGKCKEVLTELTAALDMKQGGDISRELYRIYGYFGDKVSQANIGKTKEPLMEIRPLIVDLRDSWVAVAQNSELTDAAGPGGAAVESAADKGVDISG